MVFSNGAGEARLAFYQTHSPRSASRGGRAVLLYSAPFAMSSSEERLFTPRFFVMCGFTFTVFLSALQLIPTMPFRILALGGSKFAAGLFLGFLTYASALSAPLTGALADRVGRRPMLIVCSLVLVGFSAAYALTASYRLPLALALLHGCFWSGLLSASAAYITDVIPPTRRAEGIGFWGLATIMALAVAPGIGFWLFERGWIWVCAATAALNLVMAAIAWSLREVHTREDREAATGASLIEWRVTAVSFTLFLYSFGYGAVMSFAALYADANGVAPKSIFFTTLAIVILATRPFSGRLGDRLGHRKVLLPCLVLIAAGLGLLALRATRGWLVFSAVVFGVGFGSAYPVYAAYVMSHVQPSRRGAAFGGILAAFDTGIGTGSIATGWMIQRFGFSPAYGLAACLAALSLPYFLFADRRLLGRTAG
jgi:MFS family permease